MTTFESAWAQEPWSQGESHFAGDWIQTDHPARVLVVNPLRSYWALQMCLEAALFYREAGLTVFWLDMPQQLGRLAEVCHVSADDRWRRWLYKDPSQTAEVVLERYGIEVVRPSLTESQPIQVDCASFPNSRLLLEAWEIEDFPVGSIVSAGVAGRIKERYYDISAQRKLAMRLAQAALKSKSIIEDALELSQPDCLVTTNDRVVPSAVAVSLARGLRLPTQVVDWGSIDRIHGYADSLFEPSTWRRHVEQAWSLDRQNAHIVQACNKMVEQVASQGLRHTSDLVAIREAARIGVVPPKTARLRCVHFAGTPWEFAVGREWPSSVFRSEIEAVESLCDFLPQSDWEILIRHHPPWGEFGDKSERHAWTVLDHFPHVRHINAYDPVDSLELASSADLCTTWESSIGIELLSRGQSIVAFGDPYWANPEWGIIGRSKVQLKALLESPTLAPGSEELRPVLNLLRGRGRRFRFVSGRDTDVSVAGERIFVARLRVLDWLKRLKRRSHKN